MPKSLQGGLASWWNFDNWDPEMKRWSDQVTGRGSVLEWDRLGGRGVPNLILRSAGELLDLYSNLRGLRAPGHRWRV